MKGLDNGPDRRKGPAESLDKTAFAASHYLPQMVRSMSDLRDNRSTGLKAGPTKDFLNYFGKDRWIHLWLREKRDNLLGTVFPSFVRGGIVPDTISYIGLALLAGVVIYFVRTPWLAVIFLAGHVIGDGLDGAFARYAGKASQSGAFTDLVSDQLGMVVVAMMAVFHQFVSPLMGCIYITLYLIVVVFGVIINVMGLEARITITSKYFLYSAYAVWAMTGFNLIPLMMSVFSTIMAVEVIVGYFRLKRGIRKKFDAEVRFTEGDQYTSKINYLLNVSVPLTVLLIIIVSGNWVPLRAMIDTPRVQARWSEGPSIFPEGERDRVLGFGVQDGFLLVMTQNREGRIVMMKYSPEDRAFVGEFLLPQYWYPDLTALPVQDDVLLLVDRTTHLLMGIDLQASFSSQRAVIGLTLPMRHLRITGMAWGNFKGKKVWLAANYLYTRRTYVIDPDKAVKAGYLLEGEEASYINGGFPSGIAVAGDYVIELNSSPTRKLLYVAKLSLMVKRKKLIDARRTSFAPPTPGALGPAIQGDDLVMLSTDGRLFRLPVKFFLN